MSQPTQIPIEEVLAGYKQALADANHRVLLTEAENRVLQAHLTEALTELDSLRPKEEVSNEPA